MPSLLHYSSSWWFVPGVVSVATWFKPLSWQSRDNLENGLAISFVWHWFCQPSFFCGCVGVWVCVLLQPREVFSFPFYDCSPHVFFCSAFPCVGNFDALTFIFPLPLSAIWSKCFFPNVLDENRRRLQDTLHFRLARRMQADRKSFFFFVCYKLLLFVITEDIE